MGIGAVDKTIENVEMSLGGGGNMGAMGGMGGMEDMDYGGMGYGAGNGMQGADMMNMQMGHMEMNMSAQQMNMGKMQVI